MRSRIVVGGIALLVAAGVLWILVSTDSFPPIRIPIAGEEIVVQGEQIQLPLMFRSMGILLGLVGLVLLIAGLVLSRPQTVPREVQPRHASTPSRAPTSHIGAVKYCNHCGTRIGADSTLSKARGRNVA